MAPYEIGEIGFAEGKKGGKNKETNVTSHFDREKNKVGTVENQRKLETQQRTREEETRSLKSITEKLQ
jgi:hypothetical protein